MGPTLEVITELVLIVVASAIPAIAAAWFSQHGGQVLTEAFRPLTGQSVSLEEPWPRGLQEEDPRPWGPMEARP